MKSFLSLFFTMPAKGILCALVFVLSLLFSQCSVDYISLFNQDRASFMNAVSQGDNFDYRSSYYFRSTVETTVTDVITLCFEYGEIFNGNKNEAELSSYFGKIGNSDFAEIKKRLTSTDGLHFALVRHDEKKIYSDIAALNGSDKAEDIKKFFSYQGENQLTVHSCHNPYFATDSFISFAEFIRKTASEYESNFDIYITFGTEESFRQTENECLRLHRDMRSRIEMLNNSALIYVAAIFVITLILLTVTGKQEPGGKTYPTVINRLPNDFITVLYAIVLICQVSLYGTTKSMLFSHGNELDAFWFTHSNEFYITRIRFCIVVFMCALINLLCILKREYKMGLLIKNTYIYSAVERLKNKKRAEKSD